jgi:hypothetical protein
VPAVTREAAQSAAVASDLAMLPAVARRDRPRRITCAHRRAAASPGLVSNNRRVRRKLDITVSSSRCRRSRVTPAALAAGFFGYTGVSISGTTPPTRASRLPWRVMRFTKLPVVGVLVGLSVVAACRSDNKAAPDAPVDADTVLRHIQDVQNDANAVRTPVELHGVIVTAVDMFGMRNGQVWVEEPLGGPFSGVVVFGAPLTQVANLVVGDVVDITGAVKSEFIINGDTSGRSLTELTAPTGGMMTITKTGSATPPAPVVVDALAIGTKATQTERDAEWEKWEGVLITVNNVAAIGEPSCIKSKMICTDVDSFGITGLANVESGLAAFPTPLIQGGDCFASVTGVVDYAFGYVLYHRATADIVTGGTQCPRETATGPTNQCTDGLDNDGDTFKDCMDFDCSVGANAWLGGTDCTPAAAMCGCSANLAAAIGASKVNTGTTGPVYLHDVVVTAVGTDGFWIADSVTAAQNGGVFVFTKTLPDASLVIGAKVATVQGRTETGGTGTVTRIQIGRPTMGSVIAGPVPTPITGATVTNVLDGTEGPKYAASLVKLGPLKVTAVANARKQIELTDNNGKKIMMDDNAFPNYTTGTDTPPDFKLNDCFATLTGVMHVPTDDQIRTINPRQLADIEAGVVGTDPTNCK